MHVKFSFEYGQKVTLKELEDLSKVVGKEVKNTLNADNTITIESYVTYEAFLQEIYEVIPNIIIKISTISANGQMLRLNQKIIELTEKIDKISDSVFTYNEKCEVHVPGLGLLAINETKVIEDCCTEQLDDYLTEGWRIVAVCPQPNQRRPDYVLGRTNRNRP